MLNYVKTEEKLAEQSVLALAEKGVTLVVTGGTISNIVLHYL